MKYIWKYKAWPYFTWNSDALLKPLGDVRFNQGSLLVQVRELGFDIQQTARADVLVEEALKTSAIEGEKLDPEAVRSSVGRQLGLPGAGLKYVQDQKADGLVQIHTVNKCNKEHASFKGTVWNKFSFKELKEFIYPLSDIDTSKIPTQFVNLLPSKNLQFLVDTTSYRFLF